MTTQLVYVRESVLRCHAPHPLDGKVQRFSGQTCNRRIGFPVPFLVRATGRLWQKSKPEMRQVDGRILAECQCGWVTEYEVVAPPPP